MSGATRWGRLALVALFALAALNPSTAPRTPARIHATPAASTGSWTTYHHDDGHTGYDSTQPKVASASAGWTSATLDGHLYAEPLIYNGLVYEATLNDTVYALNQSTGATVWSSHLGSPETGGWNCGNVSPQGIMGTPVIDATAGLIYVAAFFNDAVEGTDVYRVIGLSLATGAKTFDVPLNVPNFDWHTQQERGALALHNGFVYVPLGGRFGDCGPYHGYVIGVPTAGGTQPAFQTPSNGSGIWAAGGPVVDDSTGNVFATTGNSIDGCTSVNQNDAVVRLNPTTLAMTDWFMPNDWQTPQCSQDQDLGGAGPLLISPNLLFQAGKSGGGYLLNPSNLGHVDGQLYPAPSPYLQADVCLGNTGDATFGSFAYAAPFIYLECDSHGVVALNLNTSAPSFTNCGSGCGSPDWQAGGTTTFGPPIVAGGAVWVIDVNGSGLYAFDSATGAQLYHSGSFGTTHFSTPAEAGGQVFVPAGTVVKSFNMNFGCTGTPISTSYFNWYDKASPGMLSDNIHILNTGASTSTGCVTVAGSAGVAWTAGAGQETYVTMPQGTIGGPVSVTVTAGPAVIASQRVQFNQSFNEEWSETAAQASTTSYINWYDKASAGMLNDNIHVLNPGSTSAGVTISLPGTAPLQLTVAPGTEGYASFPQGTIGGPVTVTSTQPVLASQRVQFNQSFNEVWAESSTQAANTSYVNWYDKASAGMLNDNIHVLNPGATIAHVTVQLPGATSQSLTVVAGGEAYAAFPQGTIGGPVTVMSDQPVLASQRVQFDQTFNEIWARAGAAAATTSHVNWYDKASPGMYNDNIHILNPGASSATVSVSLPGAPTQNLTVPAGAEGYATFPSGSIGGPVTVTSTLPVLASQRVQFFSSFNEIWLS